MDIVLLVSALPQNIMVINGFALHSEGVPLRIASARHREDPFIELDHACA
jgi:hypothetical protein